MTQAVKLTLGPVLGFWPRRQWRDFYFRIAGEADIDTVCLGEVVCAKRLPARAKDMDAIVERLRGAGKQVILSTLALATGEAEMAAIRALCARDDLMVEANDVPALGLLDGRPHAVGPFVNVYNEGTAAVLARRGAKRICLPAEIPSDALAALAASAPCPLEVQVFGRVPLALSARCYAARARGLAKDDCRLVCAEDGDGLAVETLDGEPFLAINGTQTLSHACLALTGEMPDLLEMGFSRFRLWPLATDMVAVTAVFRALAEGRIDAEEADARLDALVPELDFCNGFYHGAEGAAFV